jgi:hypothetical protein
VQPPPSDTTPPSKPGNFQKTSATTTNIATSWTASTDNVGVKGYRLYRGSVLAGTVTGTSYTFSGLTCNTTYSLEVEATDAAGNVSQRASLSAATAACPCIPNCSGKVCGSDGCGGSCGSCSSGQSCNASGQWVVGSNLPPLWNASPPTGVSPAPSGPPPANSTRALDFSALRSPVESLFPRGLSPPEWSRRPWRDGGPTPLSSAPP